MNFETVIKQTLFLANKDQSGNVLGPEDISIAAGMASMEMLRKLCGLYEEYRPGMPISRVSAEVTQGNMDMLDMLKVDLGGLGPNDQPSLIVNSNGIATQPSNYFYCLAISSFTISNGKIINERPVSVLEEQKWKARIGSKRLNKNIEKRPYCRFRGGIIEFKPKDIGIANMSYIRYPIDPFFDYYLDVNEEFHYIPEGTSYTLQAGEMYRTGALTGTFASQSKPFEFPISLYPNLSNIILSYFGGNTRDQFIKQVAEMRKEKGI